MLKIDPSQRSMPEINPRKVCFVIEKSREISSEDDGVEADPSNASDDGGRRILTDSSYAPLRRELRQFIDDLDADEAAALVALAWIGRGDFGPEDWRAAVAQAVDRREGPTSRYLLNMALLPDYLEEALSAYGCSCEGFDSGSAEDV